MGAVVQYAVLFDEQHHHDGLRRHLSTGDAREVAGGGSDAVFVF